MGDVKAARADIGKIEVAFEIHRLAAQHSLDIGTERLEALLAEDLADRLAENFAALAPEQMRIGLAHEAIAHVAAASQHHERRAVDDGLQLGLAGAQRVFGPLALGQFLKAADRAFDTTGIVLERLDIHQHRNACAVRLFDDKLGADHALAAAHGLRDRRRIEVQRLAIGPVAPQLAAVTRGRLTEWKLAAPQFGRASVVADETGVGAADAETDRNSVERAL